MVIRENYLNTLIDAKDTEFIKVVTGVRRSGKSTLLLMYKEYLLNNNVTEDRLLELKKLSVSAVWYTGVIAHGSKSEVDGIYQGNKSIIKGEAGSPYAIRDYYDLAPELAEDIDNRFSEFDALIERTHNAGLKVIIDFVPNHVFREYKSKTDNFSDENFYLLSDQLHLPESLGGEYYENPAKATGNNCFSPYPQINDWYETIKLNYENKDTWEKMLRIFFLKLFRRLMGTFREQNTVLFILMR